MKRLLIVLVLLALAVTGLAAAKVYKAERFDAKIEVLQGGSLRVTETIVFRFEEGTFSKVERIIPTRRTDGVEFVEATMDGTPFPPGSGAGRVSVKRGDRLRVEWAFPALGPSVHTFGLTYMVRGVVQPEAGTDSIAWRALPTEHRYAIDESRIELLLPVAPIGMPRVDTRRVGSIAPASDQGRMTVEARDIKQNGWIEVSARMAGGSVITAPPDWQRRRQVHDAYRNPALLAGGAILLMGVIVLFGVRQNYDAPPRDVPAPTAFSGPPDELPPALAGTVAANGTTSSPHAFGALFSLAQRGVITVDEERGLWGTRSFKLHRHRGAHPLRPHEEAVVSLVFDQHHEGVVTMSKAHSRLTRHFSKFRAAVRDELAAAGLLDADRQRVRKTYLVVGAAWLALSLAAVMLCGVLLQRYGPWLFVVPATLILTGVASIIVAGAHTPLSNEGVRRSASWRAYRKFLKKMPDEGIGRGGWVTPHAPVALLPLAVALGLGATWAKLFKQRGIDMPPWFRAASVADAHRSFAAFVGAGAATSAHGGGGVGGGGAAGGGASGAS